VATSAAAISATAAPRPPTSSRRVRVVAPPRASDGRSGGLDGRSDMKSSPQKHQLSRTGPARWGRNRARHEGAGGRGHARGTRLRSCAEAHRRAQTKHKVAASEYYAPRLSARRPPLARRAISVPAATVVGRRWGVWRTPRRDVGAHAASRAGLRAGRRVAPVQRLCNARATPCSARATPCKPYHTARQRPPFGRAPR